MRKLSFTTMILLVISCNPQQNKIEVKPNARKEIIEFLKKEYRVLPQIGRFDTLYIAELKKKGTSLEIDSLINSRLTISKSRSLHIELIDYDNYFEYKDRHREDFFSVSLLRNTSTGKIYLDYINPDAGIIREGYCFHGWLADAISKKDDTLLTHADIQSYNSINSKVMFGESDTKLHFQRRGLESFLNDQFKFNRPSYALLDSLFNFYDSINWQRDPLIKTSTDLFEYLTRRANAIKGKDNYGNEARYLYYLKTQISLLVLKTLNRDSTSRFLWIYNKNEALRTRELFINGTNKSGFTYFITEKILCFPS
jgi:hypothetical protein